MMATQEQLTPTQQRIMDVLGDGFDHTKEELKKCVGDELSTDNNLSVHIHLLKKRLAPFGKTITSHEHAGRSYYRVVRFIAVDDE